MPNKPFPYYGGKYYMLDDIYRLFASRYNAFDNGITCFVDVFGGSGTVLANLPKEYRVKNKVYNDLNHTLYRAILDLKDENARNKIKEQFELIPKSREYFYDIRNRYESNQEISTFEFLYLIGCSYNAGMNSFSVNAISLNTKTYDATFKDALEAWKFMRDWTIECLDFRDVIKRYDSQTTFFYLDPPYYIGGKAYKVGFSDNDYQDLKSLISNMKGSYIMNESERDFEYIKSIFGEPKFVKAYANRYRRFQGSEGFHDKRIEGFWTNF
ncbi:MAG: DNA adenine methylase [Thermoplasmata archaeon]